MSLSVWNWPAKNGQMQRTRCYSKQRTSEGLLAELGEVEQRLQEAERQMTRITQDANDGTRDAEGVCRSIKRLKEEDKEKAAKSKRKRNKSCILGLGIVTASAACATAVLMTNMDFFFEVELCE
jgi:hypothetical protein